MKIKRLVIENFKSIERIELIEPNPFTVFVGPNGSGKSNIFEALEFIQLRRQLSYKSVLSVFGGIEAISRRQSPDKLLKFTIGLDSFLVNEGVSGIDEFGDTLHQICSESDSHENVIKDYKEFTNFTRLFVSKDSLVKLSVNDNLRLSLSASNFEKVLKRILTDYVLRTEIFEWLELFVPGFKAVEVDHRNELHWFEKATPDYFTKDLISDGTYNILALLTAIYQSTEPQFLCIEEPENGLNPKVVKELVNLCRYACEEYGHYIWLNTHSQTLVSQLTPDEIILIDKKEGATQTKQIKGMNLHGLPMDEAWLSNALGGGLPW